MSHGSLTRPLPPGIPPGPWPGTCAHMAYAPRSSPNFQGDIQHDFRDYQLDQRLDTISEWIGLAAQIYTSAVILIGATQDPIYDCLKADPIFDARTVWVAHDHLAAHWRRNHFSLGEDGGPALSTKVAPDVVSMSPSGLLYAWKHWLLDQTNLWRQTNPHLLRLLCLVVVGEHRAMGQAHEADLYFALTTRYPPAR